jgi:hypothetical protein
MADNQPCKSPRDRIQLILEETVARHGHRTSVKGLLSDARDAATVNARYDAVMAVWLAYPLLSSTSIGEIFHRDHASILNGMQRPQYAEDGARRKALKAQIVADQKLAEKAQVAAARVAREEERAGRKAKEDARLAAWWGGVAERRGAERATALRVHRAALAHNMNRVIAARGR